MEIVDRAFRDCGQVLSTESVASTWLWNPTINHYGEKELEEKVFEPLRGLKTYPNAP